MKYGGNQNFRDQSEETTRKTGEEEREKHLKDDLGISFFFNTYIN